VHAWPEGSVPLRALARGEVLLARRVKRSDFAFVRRRPVRACIAAPVRIEEQSVALVTLVSCARAYAEHDRVFAEELASFIALGVDAHRARSAAQAAVARTGTAMREEYLRAPPAFRISSPPPGLHFDLSSAVDEDVVRALEALGGAVDRLASSSALEPIAPDEVRHVGAEARRIANAARDILDWTALSDELPLSLSLGPVDVGTLVARAAARVGSARPLRVETVGAGALVADPRQLPTAIAHMVRATTARTTGEIALRAELTDAELVIEVSGRRRTPTDAGDARELSPWDLSVAAARRIVSAHGGRLETRAASIRAQIPREIGDREEARRRSTVVGRS
jgi:hypothetical protein